MDYLWDLVHALQIFKYIVMINANFPWNVFMFGSMMDFATLEIEELRQFIPDLTSLAINIEELEQLTATV